MKMDHYFINQEKANKIIGKYENNLYQLFKDWNDVPKKLRSTVVENLESQAVDDYCLDRLLETMIQSNFIFRPDIFRREKKTICNIVKGLGWLEYAKKYDFFYNASPDTIKQEFIFNSCEIVVFGSLDHHEEDLFELLKASLNAAYAKQDYRDIDLLNCIYIAFNIGHRIGSDYVDNIYEVHPRGKEFCGFLEDDIYNFPNQDKNYRPALQEGKSLFKEILNYTNIMTDLHISLEGELEEISKMKFSEALTCEPVSYLMCLPKMVLIKDIEGKLSLRNVRKIFDILHDTIEMSFHLAYKEKVEHILRKEEHRKSDLDPILYLRYNLV